MDSEVRDRRYGATEHHHPASVALVERTETRMRHAVRQAVVRVTGEAVADELLGDVYREPASQELTSYERSLLARAERSRLAP